MKFKGLPFMLREDVIVLAVGAFPPPGLGLHSRWGVTMGLNLALLALLLAYLHLPKEVHVMTNTKKSY